MAVSTIPSKQLIKTKTETLIANSFGTIAPSVSTDRILQIQASGSSLNLIILPIYNAEIKVYSIQNGTLVAYSGTITVTYTYY